MLGSLNHIHIWEMSPQLSCGDIYQTRTWYPKVTSIFVTLKNCENNGTKEIGLVTQTPVQECVKIGVSVVNYGFVMSCKK